MATDDPIFQPIPSNPRFINHTGTQFGLLKVIGFAGMFWSGHRQKYAYWWCRCKCGKLRRVRGNWLVTGNTASCGCTIGFASTRHGHTRNRTPTCTYTAWANMIRRCCDKKDMAYKNYGGRGIAVCKAWLESFDVFLADMGRKPTRKHSLDRIDVNGNYEPTNCRWATTKEQARNKRNNHLLTYNGVTQCMAAWAEQVGVSRSTLDARINRHRWSVAKAVTTPLWTGKRISPRPL